MPEQGAGPRVGALIATCGLPRATALALLSAATGHARERLIAHDDDPVEPAARARFEALLERHRDGEPLAYLLGWVEFHGHRFAVTREVLVPRPDTETLVDATLARLADRHAPRVLDLGTGSGAIAVAIALARPDAQLVAVERSAAALAMARDNAASLGARVAFRAGAWFDALAPGDAPFDAIVSNPPYVADADPHLPALRHEPREALVAGADGLDALRAIVAGAPARMAPGGWLLLEHGYDQGAAVRALLHDAGFAGVMTVRDAAGLERVALARRTQAAAPG